ncbi:MAG: hypothetical protein KAS72_13900 [Phycisphaerales bacterium]|nr:hypothetical protein [Phycisphaerales bacterium]
MQTNRAVQLSLAASLLATLAGAAPAEVTLEYIGSCRATDVSADGSVVAGNTADYGTFRWTEADGIVDLGRNASAAIGRAAGTPDVSADGTRISASILDVTGNYLTLGLWELGVGWTDLLPPLLPDGGLMDDAYGSAWGMSGDGEVVTGLYWRPGQPGGSAHPFRWSAADGPVDLGTEQGSGRANDADWDGNVIVGWDERPDGLWQPTVWVDGVRSRLSANEFFTLAERVNSDGTIVVGSSADGDSFTAVAAMWRWTGIEWEEQLLGALPGTVPPFGNATAFDVTDDGSLAVGYNAYGATGDAIMWTAETGVINVEDFLADHGITPDPAYDIQVLTAVSDDGSTIVGIALENDNPWVPQSFIIRISQAVPGDIDGDGDVDQSDLGILLAAYGSVPGDPNWNPDADLDGDGAVGQSDLGILLANYGTGG